jgi:hypothetical protein
MNPIGLILSTPLKDTAVTDNYFNLTITAAAIATVVSSIIASFVSIWISRRNNRINETSKLNDELIRLNTLAIQYPYLEDEIFIEGWNKWKEEREKEVKTEEDEKYLRYESYCISNFNFLERLSKHFKFKKIKIENFVQFKEIVRTHADWWNNPTGVYSNVEGYSKEFRNYVNEYLK